MRIAVYGGSFDPVTLGHMDIAARAAALFDRLYLCVVANSEKRTMFTAEQRLALLRAAAADLPNVTAELWPGVLADYALSRGARFLIRGVRNGTDFDAEYGMAQINRSLDERLETVLLPARPAFAHISSTMARDMIKYQRPLERCLPGAAVDCMKGWDDHGTE